MESFVLICLLISFVVAQDTTGVGVGATCGGIRGIQCGTRLRCDYGHGKTTPPYPDASGTCRQVCGGFAGFQCPSGLQCIYTNGNTTAPFPDASGVCECVIPFCPRIACQNMSAPTPDQNGCTGCPCCATSSTCEGGGAGAMCGGPAGYQCKTGLDCVYSDGTTTPPAANAAGTCACPRFFCPLIACVNMSAPPPDKNGCTGCSCCTSLGGCGGIGYQCGGPSGFQCKTGLQCTYANGATTAPTPSAPGSCECPNKICPLVACVNMSAPPPDENGCTGCSCCTGVGNCGGVGSTCGGSSGFKCKTGLQCNSGVCACPGRICPDIACVNMTFPPPDQNGCSTGCPCCTGIGGCGACTQDAKICTDGTTLARDANNRCNFPACPQTCTRYRGCPMGLRCNPRCQQSNGAVISVCQPGGVRTLAPPYPACPNL